MSTEEFRLKFVADLADLKKKLKDGTITVKQFQDSVRALKKEFAEAKSKAEEASKAMEGGLKAAEAAGRALGGTLGGVTGLLGDLNDAAEGASAALGGAGIAAGVAAVAIVGVGLAAGGAVAAVYSLEQAAIDAQAALILPSSTAAEVDRLSDRMNAAGEATNRLSVEAGILADALGSDVVDTITGAVLVSAEFVGLLADVASVASDAGASLSSLGQGTVDYYEATAKAVVYLGHYSSANSVAMDSVRWLTGETTQLSTALGLVESAADGVTGATSGLADRGADLAAQMAEQRAQSKQVTALERKRAEAERELARDLRIREQRERDAAAAARDHGVAAMREAEERARALADAYREIAAAAGVAAVVQVDGFDAMLARADELDAMGAEQEAQAVRMAGARKMAGEASAAYAKAEQERAFAVMEGWTRTASAVSEQVTPMFEGIAENVQTGVANAEEYQQAQHDVSREVIDSVGEVAGNLMSMAREGSTAYKILFAAQKAAAIAGITVDTAEAVTSALTIPPPFGEIAAASRIAVGASQIATVVATSIGGGAQMPIGGVAPDHTGGIVAPGEGVLTRQTVARIGEQGVRDLNSGGSGGGGQTVVQLRYGPRALETVMVDTIARPGRARSGIRSLAGRRDAVAGHRG